MINKNDKTLNLSTYNYGSILDDIAKASYAETTPYETYNIRIQLNIQNNTEIEEEYKRRNTQNGKAISPDSHIYTPLVKSKRKYVDIPCNINIHLTQHYKQLIEAILIEYNIQGENESINISISDLLTHLNMDINKHNKRMILDRLRAVQKIIISLYHNRYTVDVSKMLSIKVGNNHSKITFTISSVLKALLKYGNRTSKILIPSKNELVIMLSDFFQREIQTKDNIQGHPYIYRYVNVNRKRLFDYVGLKDTNNNLYKIKNALATLKVIANSMKLVFPEYKIKGDMFEIIDNGYPKREWFDVNFLKSGSYITNQNYSVTQKYLDTLEVNTPDIDMF